MLTGVDPPRLTAEADTAAEAILGRAPPGALEALEPVARGFRDEATRAARGARV